MKVLVACEFSGIVREAFRKRGHDAWSCDFLDAEDVTPFHIKQDVRTQIWGQEHLWEALPPQYRWDMMVAFPPCTHLAVSGAAWFKYKQEEQSIALHFIRTLMNARIPRIAIENPIGVISTKIRKPDQIVQPWMFGHPERKATCFWLKGLPLLKPTNNVRELMLMQPKNKQQRLHYLPPSKDRWKIRSRTFQGIADAMAEQWG